MAVNSLRKDIPRGVSQNPGRAASSAEGPSGDEMKNRESLEADLAAQEIDSMWDEEEQGGTRWSGGDEDKRYSD